MIRHAALAVLMLALSGQGPAQDGKDIPRELMPFQGAWKVVRGEVAGARIDDDVLAGMRFTFSGNRANVKERKGDKGDDGTFNIAPKKEPAEIDLQSAQGDRILGIYRFDKDGRLTICFGKFKGDARPKSFATKGTDNTLVVLEKLKE